MPIVSVKKLNKNHNFFWGLTIFSLLNLASAFFIEIHYDEAYYWLYSKNLSWGYFDHPPFVAFMIWTGQLLFDNQFGMRLFTVFLSTATMYVLWLLVDKKHQNAYMFWLVVFSVLLIHPYAFITTPDAPLFFFTSLFFLVYREFLKNNNITTGIALGAVVALLLYSKYHGALVVIFVTLSNLKLLGKRNYWLAALTALVLMLPHFWWQYAHQFPTFQYHLIDSHKTEYQIGVTLNYIMSQFLLAGPWLGWLFLYALFAAKTTNAYSKSLKTTGIGTFIFFLVSTFGGDFEAHWTLIAFVPLIIFSIQYIDNNQKWKRWLIVSGWVNFTLLIVVRIALITPIGNNIKFLGTIKGWKKDCIELKSKLGDAPIVFQDSWNRAARFAFYTNDKTVTNLNSGLYRRNQFDLYDSDEDLIGKTVNIVSTDSAQFLNPTKIITQKSTWYISTIPNFRSNYNLVVKQHGEISYVNNSIVCNVKIENPYSDTIFFDNACFEVYKNEKKGWEKLEIIPMDTSFLTPCSSMIKEVIISNGTLSTIKGDIFLTLKFGNLKPIPRRIKISPLTNNTYEH